MSDTTSWGYNEVMKLIGLLRKHPIIWDPDNLHFRNQFQRELAFDEISFAMNTTNDCIKRKIHTLRSQYLVEYKKLKSKRRVTPAWQYFDECKFIYKHDDVNFEASGTLNDDNNPLNLTDDEDLNLQDNDDFATESANETEHSSNTLQSPTAARNELESPHSPCHIDKDLPRKRSHSTDDGEQHIRSEDEHEKRLRSIVSDHIQDEFTIFGENIAMELRLLRYHRNIHDALKSKIIRAIKEAKYAVYKVKSNT